MEDLNRVEFATTKKKFFGKNQTQIKNSKNISCPKAGKFSKKFKASTKLSKKGETTFIQPPNSTSTKIILKNSSNRAENLSHIRHSSQTKIESKSSKSKTRNIKVSVETKKKLLVKQEDFKPKLISKSRLENFKNIAAKNRLTPRPALQTPQDLLKTPENFRVPKPCRKSSDIKPKNLSSYIKRLSLNDINKTVCPNLEDALGNNFTTCSFSTPKKFISESSFCINQNLDYSEIIRCCTPIKNNEVTENECEVQLEQKEEICTPRKLERAFSSPDSKFIYKSPDRQPKAPKKGPIPFESPGSFNFSLSSSSFDSPTTTPIPFILQPTIHKDSFAQTDLSELSPNTQLLQSLQILGKLSSLLPK